MHKKPLVAVLIFGLLLLVHSVGFAKAVPYNLPNDAQVIPRIARGIVKDIPTSVDANPGPTTSIQAGVSRTGATFCDGEWQCGGAIGQYGTWFYGDELYASYQDPENLGTCTGLPDVYTFDVTAVNWYVVENVGGTTYDMQPLVFANGGDAICPVPGAVLCAGPVYQVTLPAVGGYIIGLPFTDPCCSYTDYFAGVYVPTVVGTGVLGLVTSGGCGITCRVYNDWGGGWADLSGYLGFPDLELWSEGNTWDQNSCPGIPGVCDWVKFYDEAWYISTNPGGNGYGERFTRFNPAKQCTLMMTRFYIYDGDLAPTIRVSAYGNNGPMWAGRMYPGDDTYGPGDPSNLVYSVDIPWANVPLDPAWVEVDWSVEDPNWPTGYVYNAGDNLFTAFGIAPGSPPGAWFYSEYDHYDLSTTSAGHNGAYFGVVPAYLYYDEAFGVDLGNVMEANFCCEATEPQEDVCANPGPDSWPTWGHDYARTFATSIEVGDPCQVTSVWSQPLTGNLNSFNEPTIANNTVYSSGDNKLYSFDLTTGAPGNTLAGLPYIFANNRGNMTTDGTDLYVTGGNGQSISQWDPALTLANWVNGIGVGAGPLGGSCRFGVTAVYDVGATQVVVVGTEGAPGKLWCFETATGALFAGWGTNPQTFTAGIYHSPAYDGTALYVGTADATIANGEVYRVNASTGLIEWTFTPINPAEGFAGGVSLDGGYVYTASGTGSQSSSTGHRARIDKGTGVAAWEIGEGASLYGCPAIGRNWVYIPSNSGTGVIAVDKVTGVSFHNFAADAIGPITMGSVSQPVTVTCDNYLFAGDRNGNWWLLNITGQTAEWFFPFFGIVNGTAIATDGAGDNYAVVSIRSGNDVDGGGYVAAFKFNAGVRPRLVQNTFESNIPVPFGTGAGIPYSEPGVFSNSGCADLNINSFNLTDPLPDVSSKSLRKAESRYAAAVANATIGDDYTSYFDNSTKGKQIANRPLQLVDNELRQGEVAIENARKAQLDSKRSGSHMAAGAQFLRTSAVTITSPMIPGSSTDVSWLYDGTNLERGVDVEEIEFITDDPDRVRFGNQPILIITYVGGCLDDNLLFTWNTAGNSNEELVYNYGALADDDTDDDLHWGNDPADGGQIYEGTFFVAGTQHTGTHPLNIAGTDSAQFYMSNMYDNWATNGFAGNPNPATGLCGFDGASDIHMGYKRTGGCPGTPEEIFGGWVRTYYVDTLAYYGGTPYEAIGLNISMTEVGANDPEYGDFAFLKWDFTERYGETEGPIYAGSWCDWDIQPNGNANHGIVSSAFNGYALWDWVTPTFAYGFFDPRMTTDYCGLNTTDYAPHRINEMGQRADGSGNVSDGNGGYGLWQGSAADLGFEGWALLWDDVVNGPAREQSAAHQHQNLTSSGVYWHEDHFGELVNAPMNFAGNDTKSVVQAKYAIDMSDVGAEGATDVAAAEAKITALARRAAIWGGWARGDANMDGCVNLIDVCWLTSGNQIYPDTYNGDVDLSGAVNATDASYLLDYVTGLGPAPQGAWRFSF